MNTLHANFNGGLMSPRVGGRFDLEKLRTGCVQLKNFIPTPFGGIVKRPGIVVGEWLGNSSRSRAITFQRSVTNSNVIYLGQGWGKSRNALTTRQVHGQRAGNTFVEMSSMAAASTPTASRITRQARRSRVTPPIGSR
jgi:hypothetical protein